MNRKYNIKQSLLISAIPSFFFIGIYMTIQIIVSCIISPNASVIYNLIIFGIIYLIDTVTLLNVKRTEEVVIKELYDEGIAINVVAVWSETRQTVVFGYYLMDTFDGETILPEVSKDVINDSRQIVLDAAIEHAIRIVNNK